MNLFKECSGQSLQNGLEWLNQPVQWSFHNDGIEIVAPGKTDFFNDPEGLNLVGTAPYLYTYVDGDFELTANVNIKTIIRFFSLDLPERSRPASLLNVLLATTARSSSNFSTWKLKKSPPPNSYP